MIGAPTKGVNKFRSKFHVQTRLCEDAELPKETATVQPIETTRGIHTPALICTHRRISKDNNN